MKVTHAPGEEMVFLSGLRNRERIPELMDDPALPPSEHRCALAGLARVNRWSGSVGVLWPAIRNLARKLGRPIRILDVATGSGDLPAALLARAARLRLPIHVAGCDISPTAVASASKNCPQGEFFVLDAVSKPLPTGFDVLTCSLFLHHLSNEEAIVLLRNMKEATNHLVLVNDLARSRFNYLSVWWACRVLTRSRVVHFDGPASVRSAFTPTEALTMARQAGLSEATVKRRFPCRFLLSWNRTL